MKKYVTKWMLFTLLIIGLGFKVQYTQAATITGYGTNILTAQSFSLGDVIQGQFSEYGEPNHYYKLVLKKGACINLTGRTNASNKKMYIDLIDRNGKNIAFSWSTDVNHFGYQKIQRYYSLSAGTYYINIESANQSALTYSVKLTAEKTESTTVKIAGLDNNYLNKAVPFSVGNTLKGVATQSFGLSDWNPCHYYKFRLPSKQTIKITGKSIDKNTTQRLWVDLCNSQGK